MKTKIFYGILTENPDKIQIQEFEGTETVDEKGGRAVRFKDNDGNYFMQRFTDFNTVFYTPNYRYVVSNDDAKAEATLKQYIADRDKRLQAMQKSSKPNQ